MGVQNKLTPDSILMTMILVLNGIARKIGPELIATFLQNLCKIFEKHYIEADGDDSKYLQNCIIIFTIIYRFKIIKIGLINDIIQKLLTRCLEQDIEIFLLCLRCK